MICQNRDISYWQEDPQLTQRLTPKYVLRLIGEQTKPHTTVAHTNVDKKDLKKMTIQTTLVEN